MNKLLGLVLCLHKRLPKPDILLLACDMLDLDEMSIATLLARYRQEKQDFTAYGSAGKWQPFCCLYTSAGLEKAWPLVASGQLTRYSLQSVLQTGTVNTLSIERPLAFSNYNSQI